MTEPFVRAALIGVGRDAGLPSTGTIVDAVVPQVEQRERAFLLRAAARELYLRAGLVPANVPAIDAAPAETLRTPSPRLAELIADSLEENDPELLRATGEALTHARMHVPHRVLPEVLAQRENETKAAFAAAVGERGRWLARQNAAWSWAVQTSNASDVATQWEEGSPQQRVAALREMRAADPATARDALVAVFAQEKAEQRVALLETLEVGISQADEEFLERALDDRSLNVKGAAADLLAHLPQSAFSKRMQARAEAAVRLELPDASIWSKVKALGKTAGGAKLVVEPPPKTLDPAAARDIVPARGPVKTGDRAWSLMQIVASVPLATWTTRFALPAAQILALARQTDWEVVLVRGWIIAATRERNAEWARALVAGSVTLDPDRRAQLAAALAPEDLIDLIAGTEKDGRGWDFERLIPLVPRPWPEPFARAWLQRLRRAARAGSVHDWTLTMTVGLTARALPWSLFGDALAAWELTDEPALRMQWERLLQRFTKIIDIRRTIGQESDE